MPNGKRTRAQAIFALAIVKSSIISSRTQASKVQAALQMLFPGVSIILVAEDHPVSSYQHRRELSDFADEANFKIIPSSKISAN